MFLDNLTEENFLLYASRNYYNPAAFTLDEFNDDLLRFKYVKRLLNRHSSGKLTQIRLLLNHIIVICNVFGVESGIEMLLFKNPDEYDKRVIITILRFLGYIDKNKFTTYENEFTIMKMLEEI